MPFAQPKIRDDLIYTPDQNDDSYYFVKCPIRNEFFHFNELQVTLMEALDGARDTEELIEVVGEEWGVELSPMDVKQFSESLSELLLLDISSYDADDKRVRQLVRKRIDKLGISMETAPRKGDPESELFHLGMRHALSDSPLKATSYFQAVLEINPENERAKQVLTCIHEAFFHCHRADLPLNSRSIRLFGPDKFLGRIDKRIGRYVFSVPGAIATAVLCLLCVPLALELAFSPDFKPSTIDTADVVAFGLISLVGFLVHELGHAFSCKHYGGHPDDLGFLFIYGLLPGAYCDTSDSYTFTETRHKVVTFLSGVIAQLLFSTFLLTLLFVVSPDMPGWQGLTIAVLIDITTVYGDLNPLMPLDGYYALADWLKITNLRGKSYAYVWSIVARIFFGVRTSQFDESTSREKRIYAIYGLLSISHMLFIVVVVVLNFTLPLLSTYLGKLGVIICIFILLSLSKRFLKDAIYPFLRFLIDERKQIFTIPRVLMYAIVGALLAFALSHEERVHVRSNFYAEPAARSFVNPTETGIVEEVLVREGDWVEKDQLLAALRSRELERELARATSNVAVAEAQLNMLLAGARREEIAMARSRSKLRESEYAYSSAQLRQTDRLLRDDVATDAEMLDAKEDTVRARNHRTIAKLETDLLLAGTREEELNVARATLDEANAYLEGLLTRKHRLEIRSPIAGRVVTPRVHEMVGSRISEGSQFVEIVDDSKWKLHVVPLPGESIEGLEIGHEVRARAWGYPGDEIRLAIAKVLPPDANSDTRTARYETGPFTAPLWSTGLSGHARIYGPERSAAYRYFAEPIAQTFNLSIYDIVMQ